MKRAINTDPMFNFGGALVARPGGMMNLAGDTTPVTDPAAADTGSTGYVDDYGNDVEADANGNITATYLDNADGTQTVIPGSVTKSVADDGTVTYTPDSLGTPTPSGSGSGAGAAGIFSGISKLFGTPSTPATSAKPATQTSGTVIVVVVVVVVVIIIAMAMGGGKKGK